MDSFAADLNAPRTTRIRSRNQSPSVVSVEAWITPPALTKPDAIERREFQLHRKRIIRFGGCGFFAALEVQIQQKLRGVDHARGRLEPLEAIALKSTAP